MHASVAEARSTPESQARGRGSWLVRWSPLGGLLWFLAYPVGELIGTGSGTTPAEVVERAESHQAGIGIIQIVVLLSPLLLGWFVGGLYVRLSAAGAEAESVLALIGGVTFIVLLSLADTIVFAPLLELPNKDDAVQATFAQAIPVLEAASWTVQGGAGVAAALMIVASSIGARRTGSLAGWIFWISLALGVVSLFTIGFIGVFAWLFWIGLASIAMLARLRA
jgi:hypothetical protein